MVENLSSINLMMQGIHGAMNNILDSTRTTFAERQSVTKGARNLEECTRPCIWRFFMVHDLGSTYWRSSRIFTQTSREKIEASMETNEHNASVRASSTCAAKALTAFITVVIQFWAPRWLCHSIARSEIDQRPLLPPPLTHSTKLRLNRDWIQTSAGVAPSQ